jgi:hypothetical protein
MAQRIEAARWGYEGSLEQLRSRAHDVFGTILTQATRQLHGASVRTKELVASIPIVMKTYNESRHL